MQPTQPNMLPARSKTRLKVTFQPAAAGRFEFVVAATVRAVDAAGVPLELSSAESALMQLGENSRHAAILRGTDPFTVKEHELLGKPPPARDASPGGV